MISTFILTLLSNFVNGLIGLLPTGHLPIDITSAINYFWSLVNSFNFFIPVDTLLQAVLVVLVFDGTMFVWYGINWIIRRFPTQS